MPPARTTLALRFDQFRRLTLTRRWRRCRCRAADPHAGLLGQRPSAALQDRSCAVGGELEGTTVGHVETELGLFIFPPLDDAARQAHASSRARRTPASRSARSIGEVLVEQQVADSGADRAGALDEQQQLRTQKLGDMLVDASRSSRPSSCSSAIERRRKMPMVRIGEALLRARPASATRS